jgi:hypothetical protein
MTKLKYQSKQDLTYTYPKNKLFDAMRICYIYNVVRPESVPKKIQDISDLSPEQKNKIFSKFTYDWRCEFYEMDEHLSNTNYSNIKDIINNLNKGINNDK